LLAFIFAQTLGHWGVRWALTAVSAPFLLLGVADVLRGVRWAKAARPSGPDDTIPGPTDIKGVGIE
jgi:hypothetical protein